MCRYVVTRRDREGKMILVGETDRFSEAWSLAHDAHSAAGSEVVLWDEDDPTPFVKLGARAGRRDIRRSLSRV
jgi:hypothetical protein